MNQQTQRTAVDRFASQRERLKGERRSVSGVDIERVKSPRERADQPMRPSIQRIRSTITIFRGLLKSRPLARADHAEQHQTSSAARSRIKVGKLVGQELTGASQYQTHLGHPLGEFIKPHRHHSLPVTPSVRPSVYHGAVRQTSDRDPATRQPTAD